MIAELHDYVSPAKRKVIGKETNQIILLPEPAMQLEMDGKNRWYAEREEGPTFSVYPQERAGGFPLIENCATKEPLSGSLVLSVACNVVISGWICRREPSSKASSEMVP